MMNDNEKAWEIIHKFTEEVCKKYKRKIIYVVTGSVVKNNYVHGKSDIDMIILPRRGIFYPQHYLDMLKMGEKYGIVHKKGRYIGVIDCLIFMNGKFQKETRQMILKDKRIKYYEVNCR